MCRHKKTCIYNKYISGKSRQMRYEKANKLLLRCAQATFRTPLIVHNYSRLTKLFQRYMVQESISIRRLLWRPDKVLSNWCRGHFCLSES